MSTEDGMSKAERVRARMNKARGSRMPSQKRGRAVSPPAALAAGGDTALPPQKPTAPAKTSAAPRVSVSVAKTSSEPSESSVESLEVFATKSERVVRTAEGEYLDVPDAWALLPPGDAAVTRRVKAAGPCWTVKEKRGRRMFSRGIWADAATIAREQEARAAEVETPAYKKKLNQSRSRAAKKQEEYVEDFTASVRDFLQFSSKYSEMEQHLAEVVSEHATPVGSGTVARTERIPIAQRAEAAVIAWMRHQTTAYDTMHIPRVKGKRREVRRMLAERSRQILERYRRGDPIEDGQRCPLRDALEKS